MENPENESQDSELALIMRGLSSPGMSPTGHPCIDLSTEISSKNTPESDSGDAQLGQLARKIMSKLMSVTSETTQSVYDQRSPSSVLTTQTIESILQYDLNGNVFLDESGQVLIDDSSTCDQSLLTQIAKLLDETEVSTSRNNIISFDTDSVIDRETECSSTGYLEGNIFRNSTFTTACSKHVNRTPGELVAFTETFEVSGFLESEDQICKATHGQGCIAENYSLLQCGCKKPKVSSND